MKSDPTPTPPSQWQPNRLIRVGVRVARTYLQGVLGFLGASSLGGVVPGSPVPVPIDAGHALALAFYAALFPALVSLIQNLLEEANHWDPGTSLRG